MALRGTWPQRWRYPNTRGWLRENSRTVLTEAFFGPQPPSEISGTASLELGADLWLDGPRLVLPGQQRQIEYTGVYRRPTYGSGTRFAFFQPVDIPIPSGDVLGATTLTFGVGTASLTGAGALAASGTLTFDDGTSVLTGTGALATVTPLTLGNAAALTGAGALAGSGALVFGGAGAFDQGPITGSVTLTFGQSAALTGAGSLAGATALTIGTAAALAGSGALAGSTALLLGADAAVSYTAQISGTAALAFDASLAYAATPEAGDEFLPGGYRAELQRQRRRRRRDDDESKTPGSLPAEAQAGPGSSVATPTAPAADLELVRQLVAYWSGEGDREQLNRRAQRALDYALRAQSVLAMQLFERELARQMEDDEMSALLMLLADDD